MENTGVPGRLVGSEIHGFRTLEDLDVGNMMEEAKARWLRPNEIHAILCNHKYFTVYVKPVNLPKSGTIVLFDRKMLRNFRKDGHNWKKKKDGKTVKEAHEHLKNVANISYDFHLLGGGLSIWMWDIRLIWSATRNEFMYTMHMGKTIQLLFADVTGYLTSLWNILSLYTIVKHKRRTRIWSPIASQLQSSPATPVNSNSNSAGSELSATRPMSEESDSAVDRVYYGGAGSYIEFHDSVTIKHHEQRLHEINTLEWDELLVPDDPHGLITPQGTTAGFELRNQYQMNSYRINDDALSNNKASPESSANSFSEPVAGRNSINYTSPNNMSYQIVEQDTIVNSETMISGLMPSGGAGSLHNLRNDGLQSQDSFGRWVTHIIAESPESVDDHTLESSNLAGHQSFTYPLMDSHHPSPLGPIFTITDVSPAWALSTEETKILVVGFFNEGQLPYSESKLYLACGDSLLPVDVVQAGVFRCLIPPQAPKLGTLYMTFDGHKPISQVLTFEIRAPVQPGTVSFENKTDWEEFQLQMRLARLLFSSSKGLSIYSTKLSPTALKEAKAFAQKTSHISDGWLPMAKMIEDAKLSFPQAKDKLFELTLQNRLQEWLLEKVVAGCKISERDEQGLGVIHLCSILGYTWAVYPYSWSGLSLDYRDKFGWTALHWAAYYGREKMVATLLSAGAKPNLVTDPTSQNPKGRSAHELASENGYDGLAAYLAEKALVAQFDEMALAGNVSGPLQTTTNEMVNPGNFSEEELYLKDTLAAYRTAADAAARIQTAFREHSLKVRTKVVESSNPELEARTIVAAMKIQHAFRKYETRKKMAAAARIQHRFRTWKIRNEFLNLRRQAIKIQAMFRGYQVRRQYRKIVWSVGILEKAILRWRLKRKGFRGLQVEPAATPGDPIQESDVEEDFFQASRKQAEERVEESVIKVQAMFRSKQAQEAYRRMKLEHNKAKVYGSPTIMSFFKVRSVTDLCSVQLEYEGLLHPDLEMGREKRKNELF
ncbi:Calmodulin-binding transcription activator 5 [Sesamum angolense]|uniref:Calmodulin-binding transcription activator 5 n=1 Tax=Sesamum angolense TaxID=2727404 RepID=A0AAE1X5G1_9LAMI|nr:Calmodulin-binding transcription activator 5 [Sesamum angolense]